MPESRRTFLESIGSYLASLPLFGWLARPERERSVSLSDAATDRLIKDLHDENGLRFIRWIPVSDSVPEVERKMGGIFGVFSLSKLVLMGGTEDGRPFVSCGRHTVNCDGSTEWNSDEKIVTHWAELPCPPSGSREDQNHTALCHGISLSDSREGA